MRRLTKRLRRFIVVPLVLMVFIIGEALGGKGPSVQKLAEKNFTIPARKVAFYDNGKPKVVVGSERIQFLDPQGRMIKELALDELSGVVFSPQGNFVGIGTHHPPGKDEMAPRKLTFDVYNAGGIKRYQLSDEVGYDDPLPVFYLSDQEGVCAKFLPGETMVYFYDKRGKSVGQVDLFPDDEWGYEKTSAGSFSGDGQWFLLTAQPREAGFGINSEPTLFCFDGKGNQRWRNETGGSYLHKIFVSHSGRYVAAEGVTLSDDKRIIKSATIFDDRGGVLLRWMGEALGETAFSPDETYLGRIADLSLKLIDLKELNVVWEKDLSHERSWEGRGVRALRVSDRGDVLLLISKIQAKEGRFFFVEPEVFFFDKNGRPVWSQSFPNQRFEKPGLYLSKDGDIFSIGFERGYSIYRKEP